MCVFHLLATDNYKKWEAEMNSRDGRAVIFFGHPASGCRTQAEILCSDLGARQGSGFVVHRISMSDFIASFDKKQLKHAELKAFIPHVSHDFVWEKMGERFLPDGFMFGVINHLTSLIPTNVNFVVAHGLCNTVAQAKHLQARLETKGLSSRCHHPVHLRVCMSSRVRRQSTGLDIKLLDEHFKRLSERQSLYDEHVPQVASFYSRQAQRTVDIHATAMSEDELALEVREGLRFAVPEFSKIYAEA